MLASYVMFEIGVKKWLIMNERIELPEENLGSRHTATLSCE
jgi:hypothetical protein